MFNFLASCGLCSTRPRPGDYAYEAFSKQGNQGQGRSQQVSQGLPPLNNMPKDSVIAGDYTFHNLANDNPREVYIRKIKKSQYSLLVKQHEETGQQFTDLEFPPDQSSVGQVEDLRVRATWKRIPDVIQRPLFVEGIIEPKDIFQGSLGDGYFLSAISALAEKDSRIKNLFPELQVSKHGIYMVRVLHKGVLQQVIVDDYIPVNQQGDPLFAKPAAGREIWVIILEKVWAKLHGSYGAIVGGLPSQVLQAFSGAPTYLHEIPSNRDKLEQLEQLAFKDSQQGAIFCATTRSPSRLDNCGLIPDHAYTILDFHHAPYRMLRLRSPRGSEWRGRAGRGDRQFWASISPIDRQRLTFSEQGTDSFFMLWEDFANCFDILSVCKMIDNASSSNCELSFFRKNAELFEFETAGGNVTLTLSQPPPSSPSPSSNASSSNASSSPSVSRSIMIVAKQSSGVKGFEYSYISSSTNNLSFDHNLELSGLGKGKYVVYAKCLWNNNQVSQVACLNIYMEYPTHLVHVSQSKHKRFLYQTFLDHARNNPKKQSIGPGEWVCSDLLLKECGYGYLAFHLDEQSSRKLGIEIAESDYTERRFVLKKPYKGKGTIKTSVAGGSETIVLFHIKSQTLPQSVTLPSAKFYNLI